MRLFAVVIKISLLRILIELTDFVLPCTTHMKSCSCLCDDDDSEYVRVRAEMSR